MIDLHPIQPEQPPLPRDGVAPELIDELHEANEQLHRAGHHLDEALNSEESPLAKRDQASDEVREAAKRLEKIDEKITKELHVNEK